MKIQNSYEGLRCNGQFIYCSFPFSLDTYQGCTHNCQYCFSYFNYLINASTKGKNFFEETKSINYEAIKKCFDNTEPLEKDSNLIKIYKGLIKERMPIHWGGIADPFSSFESLNEEKVSLKFLKLFNKYQYPVIMSTKSKWLVDNEEYLKEITENKNLILQVSLISINPELNKIENNTSIEKRLELIKKISPTNRVVVRCQPFIPGLSDKNIEEYMSTIAQCGAKAVTIEFLKLTNFKTTAVKKAINELSNNLGYDLIKFYKFKGAMTSTDTELKTSYKLPILLRFKELAHMYGLEFYSADNALRDYGDSPICCGIPLNYPGFEKYFSCNTSVALFKSKEKPELRYEDLFSDEKLHDKIFLSNMLSTFQNLGSSEGHLRYNKKTMLDKLAYVWDNPKNYNNPASFFHNLVISGKDKNGHLIYKYKKND